MAEKQNTIKGPVSLVGVGLHTGREVSVCLRPAPENSGISFIRTDTSERVEIKAEPSNVLADEGIPRCTTIGKDGVCINTVEHLMGVLCGLGIDNLLVEVNGDEMPGMDGSGIDYFEAIRESGIVEQEAERQYVDISEPICVHRKDASIFVVPDREYKVSYVLDYDHAFLKSQFFSTVVNEDRFREDIAPCRTFCLEAEAKALQSQGLGKGANFRNTLVVGEAGVIDNKVRFHDEFARHKILDFIGDLYLLGRQIRGHVFAVKSGHELNFDLLNRIHSLDQQRLERISSLPCVCEGQTKLDIYEIMKILPHRYPFLLVDKIISLDKGVKATGVKNVTMNEDFFKGHFPGRPLMPGVLMVEAMAQVAGIVVLTGEEHQGKLGLFMATDNVKFRKMVTPGDQLVLEAQVVKDRSRIAILHGTAKVQDEIVAEADVTISFVDESFLSEG